MLAAAGAGNLEFEILYSTARPEHVAMANIFQGDLTQIGVGAKLKSAELASYFAQVQAVSYNGMAAGSGVSSQLQPQTLLLGVYHSPVVNLSGYKNETWASLVDDVSSELDPTRNQQLFAFLKTVPCQALITTTRPTHVLLAEERKDFQVLGGAVLP